MMMRWLPARRRKCPHQIQDSPLSPRNHDGSLTAPRSSDHLKVMPIGTAQPSRPYSDYLPNARMVGDPVRGSCRQRFA